MQMNLKRMPRLFVDAPVEAGKPVPLSSGQCHYLLRVMRLQTNDPVRLFNATDGEWLCQLEKTAKNSACAIAIEKLRQPHRLADIDYLFAPLKTARLDYMVQKATEMGVARLRPVITEYTQTARLKHARLAANAVAAAEQCNLVAVPEILRLEKLSAVLSQWDHRRQLVFCDEAAAPGSPLPVLEQLQDGPLALLVGPEGGFSPAERKNLLECRFVTPISLGPRIMRADTAAVSALTLLQALKGDWPREQ